MLEWFGSLVLLAGARPESDEPHYVSAARVARIDRIVERATCARRCRRTDARKQGAVAVENPVPEDRLSNAQHVVEITGRLLADSIRSLGRGDPPSLIIDGHRIRLSDDGLSVVIKPPRRSRLLIGFHGEPHLAPDSEEFREFMP